VSRARLVGATLAAAWALAIAAAFALLEPSETGSLAVLWPALRGVAVAVVAAVACAGAGAALLSRLQPACLDDPLGWLWSTATGLVLWGLVSWPAAALLGVTPWLGGALLVLLAAGWLLRPAVHPPRVSTSTIAWGLVILAPALIALLSPIADTDELYYHLALPARLLEESSLLGGPWMPNGSRPLALHLPYTWLVGLGGFAAPRAFHLLLAVGLLLGVQQRARAWWGPAAGVAAPLLLVGSTSVLDTMGLAYADLPTALLVLMAADAVLAGRLRSAALAAGGALAIKYTAALALVPLFAWLCWRQLSASEHKGRTAGHLALAALAAVAVVAPWWLRNLIDGLHPLFPFSGWQDAGPFVFQFPERYGMGHGWLDTLLLPWNLTVHAEHDSMVFLGRVSPAFLALLPAACWAAWRDRRARALLAVCAAGLLLWSFGTQWLRYLLPLLPLAALLAAAGLARLPRWGMAAAALCWLVGLPSNLRPVLSDAVDRAPVALGLEDRDAYLARTVDAWPAIRWINGHSPADTRIALLYSWQAALIERPWLLGSVEDHVPTRHLVALHGDHSLQALRDQGATHALISRVNLLRKSYPFLSDEEFATQFDTPEQQLEDALDREAALVFEQGRFAIYEI